MNLKYSVEPQSNREHRVTLIATCATPEDEKHSSTSPIDPFPQRGKVGMGVRRGRILPDVAAQRVAFGHHPHPALPLRGRNVLRLCFCAVRNSG